jgi:RNA polymerase sigma-70 factor (ECF subfamily)
MDVIAQQSPSDAEVTFDVLFERHHDRVRRYVVSRVGPDAADDVVADTFVEAFRARRRFDATRGQDAAPWLLGIATNMLARHRSAERRWLERQARALAERPDEPFDERAVERADAGDRRADLVASLAALPERERTPLLLHVLGGCSYEDVAIALDVPIGTVRSRISRGTARLRRGLS